MNMTPLALIRLTSGRPCQGWGGAPRAPPIYLGCFWSDFKNSFVCWKLVKIVIDFHSRQLSISHPLTARCRRSDKGQSLQYFEIKNQFLQFLSYINVIYLKRLHFSCRNQIQTKNMVYHWIIWKKNQFFPFWVKNEGDQVCSTANFSNFCIANLKMTLPKVVKRFESKSHQIWAHYL